MTVEHCQALLLLGWNWQVATDDSRTLSSVLIAHVYPLDWCGSRVVFYFKDQIGQISLIYLLLCSAGWKGNPPSNVQSVMFPRS